MEFLAETLAQGAAEVVACGMMERLKKELKLCKSLNSSQMECGPALTGNKAILAIILSFFWSLSGVFTPSHSIKWICSEWKRDRVWVEREEQGVEEDSSETERGGQ